MSPGPSEAGIVLANLPVLAELAVHVTTRSRDRKSHLAGKKMEERLLLDRVDVGGDNPRVNQRVIGPAPVFADPAIAAVAVLDAAPARAQFAPTPLVGQFLVNSRLD